MNVTSFSEVSIFTVQIHSTPHRIAPARNRPVLLGKGTLMLQTNCLAILAAALAFGCSSVKAQKNSDDSTNKAADASANKNTEAPATKEQPVKAGKTGEAAPAKPAPTPEATPAPTLDPALVKAVGETNLKIIASSDKVTIVDVSSAKGDAKEAIQGHAVKGDPKTLGPAAAKALKGYLLDKESHRLGMRARCRFRPVHGFVFHHGEKTTSVLYASKGNCPKWSFTGTPKRSIIDVKKSVSKGMKALLKEIRGDK
jgi:type IV secretory pathway VirB10-like protein